MICGQSSYKMHWSFVVGVRVVLCAWIIQEKVFAWIIQKKVFAWIKQKKCLCMDNTEKVVQNNILFLLVL